MNLYYRLSSFEKHAKISTRRFKNTLLTGIFAICFTACTDSRAVALQPETGSGTSQPGASLKVPTPKVKHSYQTDALVFTGDGTWGTEINSLENILSNNNATFKEVTSAELNAMSLDDLGGYGVMIFPGGEGGTEAGSLTSDTHARLRAAVQQLGVSYLGFCAGSFIAVAPAPSPGEDVSYGLGIVDGPLLQYYNLENQGIDISMTLDQFPDGSTEDILWYGGPVTPEGTGSVVAKYPDGTPSISQIWSGNGLVILSGGHPTATQATLDVLGVSSSDGLHLDLAWKLIDAAIHQTPLPAF